MENLAVLLDREDVVVVASYKDYKVLCDYRFKYFFFKDDCFFVGKNYVLLDDEKCFIKE